MLFNSLQFLLFFPVVAGLYFAWPRRWRWALLLVASYYFYMCWKPEYVLLILASTVVDYCSGLKMSEAPDKRSRRPWLLLSLSANLGLLFAFKYWNFFADSTRDLLGTLNIFADIPEFSALLPVGISFYTFQTLSYSIDIYRGQLKPERHFGRFALFVSFFPQLVAGPIERASRLLPQFRLEQNFDYERLSSGLRQMIWGMFKKVVVADRLAVYVDAVYSDPGAHQGLPLIAATYFFAFQIYCDFSGYSDIAIGAARVLGFDLMENFRRPYLARTLSDFWRRWHISLSTWFRDYVYIPLGGNRASTARWYGNLAVTFLVSGLWHGANWTFVAWGALHGGYLIFAIVTSAARERLFSSLGLPESSRSRAALDIVVTFHLALVAWVFFRADSLGDALLVFQQSIEGLSFQLAPILGGDVRAAYQAAVIAVGVPKSEFALGILGLLFVAAVDFVQERGGLRLPQGSTRLLRFAWYDLLILLIILLGAFGQQQFIYFQF